MQSKITGDTKVSPSEVRAYYNTLPNDSLPLIDAEYEIAQIVKKPGIDEVEKNRVREKLEAIRKRIVNGEDFSTLAVLYSDDTESAKRGGELGFVGRNDLVPEFSAEAFNLRGKEISRIVESPFGYHIIQLIARRGEMINVRHILMIPKPSQDNFLKAQRLLDSLRIEIAEKKSISFEDAALRFSDDSESKNNGGIMFNPRQGNTRFNAEEMEPGLFFIVDKLKTGELSPVSRSAGQDGKPISKLVLLKSRTQPHRANPREDYQRLQQMVLMQKQAKLVNDWVNKKRKTTFIKISGDYSSCRFKNQWTDK
jgi:peptidyl-prolyl cis-trans isomerase SurA